MLSSLEVEVLTILGEIWESAKTGAIVGGIGGVIGAYLTVRKANQALRELPCPECGSVLGDNKPGKRTYQQTFWGGWTCPGCGCDVDRHGKRRES